MRSNINTRKSPRKILMALSKYTVMYIESVINRRKKRQELYDFVNSLHGSAYRKNHESNQKHIRDLIKTRRREREERHILVCTVILL